MKIGGHRFIWYAAGIGLCDVILFGSTNARTVPAYIAMVGLFAVAFTVWAICYGLLKLLQLYGIRIRRQKRLAAYATGLLGGAVAFQSIGQLSLRDVVVLLPLAALSYAYSVYAKSAGRNLGA